MASRIMDAATGRLAFIALAIGMLALPVACSREGASDRSRTASSASGTVTRQDTSTPENLAGTHWRLVEVQSKPQTVRPNDPSKYTLAFDPEGRIVYMQLDCNRANGPYDDQHDSQRHEGTITI